MIYVKSNAVFDQVSQHHLGTPFAGHISLLPVPVSKAQMFKQTIDSDAEFLDAAQAAQHLAGVVNGAVTLRSDELAHLTEWNGTAKRYVADLRKLVREANPAETLAQASHYLSELASALEFDVEGAELDTAEFVTAIIDEIAFDISPVKAKLSELADATSAATAARRGIADCVERLKAMRNEIEASNISAGSHRDVATHDVLAELASLKAGADAFSARIDTLTARIRAIA